MAEPSTNELLAKIQDLENRLAESDQLIEAIQAGEVDAFAINANERSEIYTLQSGDYAYRVLIEEFGEGAINVTEDGLIVYTNSSFLEMVKKPYEKVIGKSVFEFIHASSLETFKAIFKDSLGGKSKCEVALDLGDMVLYVYISLTSLQPKLPTVGMIITDLTEKKKNEEIILKYQKDLEEKNLELARNNEELASFAYIASHDLQEPLRKIQTFSNMILSKDADAFSSRTMDYFQRIISASKRMQNLIKALLGYSRINNTEFTYSISDLNSIVGSVKQELCDLIEETDTVIEVAELPTLKVVPHQLNQLFSNMIINAIKYRRKDVSPVIRIAASLDRPGVCGNHKRGFWKIAISDNGIGFDQEYADKIFELFQRLHGSSAYEGAGIGLAICKKIVMNHQGRIEAIGQPDEGATFNVFLPAEVQ